MLPTFTPNEVIWTLTLLSMKHTLADFIFQSEWMIEQKGYYGKPWGLAHAGLHGFLTAVAFLMSAPVSVPVALGLGAIDAVSHYHIDYIKSQLCRHLGLTVKDKNFWNLIGLDQFMHYLTYLTLVYIA
jgi:hypothetical protein